MSASATSRAGARGTLRAHMISTSSSGTPAAHPSITMPTDRPRSYDEITRSTVPEPDSSFRPTKLQEQQAREGFRKLDDDEQVLHDRVIAALGGAAIEVEVDRARVTLRGQVPSGAELRSLEDRVRAVEGVADVRNDLVIRS